VNVADTLGFMIQEPVVRITKKSLKGGPKAYRLFQLEIQISAVTPDCFHPDSY